MTSSVEIIRSTGTRPVGTRERLLASYCKIIGSTEASSVVARQE